MLFVFCLRSAVVINLVASLFNLYGIWNQTNKKQKEPSLNLIEEKISALQCAYLETDQTETHEVLHQQEEWQYQAHQLFLLLPLAIVRSLAHNCAMPKPGGLLKKPCSWCEPKCSVNEAKVKKAQTNKTGIVLYVKKNTSVVISAHFFSNQKRTF